MKLSICIPTYNFGKFIGETLESIIPQLTDDVEIVILDGASMDDTEQVVRSYEARNSQIRYFREPKKGGIDNDMHLSVEKARGEYCWLFSSDDVMEKGALGRALEEIQLGLDVYVCGFTIYNLDMSAVLQEYRFSTLDKPAIFDLSDPTARVAYFESAVTTAAFFSFMSSLIVKRKRWIDTMIEPSFIGTCWAHAGRIFRMIPQGLRVKHMPSSFLLKRSFNDSFMDKGFLHRVSIGINGYQNIADAVFGRSSIEAFHVRRTLRNEFFIDAFVLGREDIKSLRDVYQLFRLITTAYEDCRFKKWMLIVLIFTMPKWLINRLRHAHAILRNFHASGKRFYRRQFAHN